MRRTQRPIGSSPVFSTRSRQPFERLSQN